MIKSAIYKNQSYFVEGYLLLGDATPRNKSIPSGSCSSATKVVEECEQELYGIIRFPMEAPETAESKVRLATTGSTG